MSMSYIVLPFDLEYNDIGIFDMVCLFPILSQNTSVSFFPDTLYVCTYLRRPSRLTPPLPGTAGRVARSCDEGLDLSSELDATTRLYVNVASSKSSRPAARDL